jgi:hypothetical protein
VGTLASPRITIQTSDGKPRVLASLIERKMGRFSGDLVLNLRPGARSGVFGEPLQAASFDDRYDVRILEHEYSLHQSKESVERINIITHSQMLSTGDCINEQQLTYAIKSGNRFAPLYVRRFSDLSSERYDLKREPGRDISLGQFDETAFTLVMGVFASAPSLDLNLMPDDFNIEALDFSHFRITVLWSYIPYPAYLSGLFLNFRAQALDTVMDQNTRETIERIMAGFTPFETVIHFKTLRALLTSAMVASLSADAHKEGIAFSVDEAYAHLEHFHIESA